MPIIAGICKDFEYVTTVIIPEYSKSQTDTIYVFLDHRLVLASKELIENTSLPSFQKMIKEVHLNVKKCFIDKSSYTVKYDPNKRSFTKKELKSADIKKFKERKESSQMISSSTSLNIKKLEVSKIMGPFEEYVKSMFNIFEQTFKAPLISEEISKQWNETDNKTDAVRSLAGQFSEAHKELDELFFRQFERSQILSYHIQNVLNSLTK